MALSQGILNRLATQGMQMLGTLTEPVTYAHKTGSNATSTSHALTVHFEFYNANEVDGIELRRTDNRVRIPKGTIAFTPTRWDEITRTADSSVWRVMSVEGGLNRPWWLLQAREGA